MFGFLNRSNPLNNTDQSVNMLPSEHKCNEIGCTGDRFMGCNLTCSRCFSPKFIECISDRTEIIQLLTLLKIAPDLPVSQLIAKENTDKIKSLFFPESILQFMCPQCANDGSILDIKLKNETRIKSLEQKNKDLRKENKDYKEKCDEFTAAKIRDSDEIEKLKETLNDVNDQNYEKLKNDNAKLQSEIDELNAKLNDVKCVKCDDLRAAFTSIEIFANEISDSIDKLNYECEGYKNNINKNKNDIDDLLRSLNLCIPDNTTNLNVPGNKNSNTFPMNNGLDPNSGVFYQTENKKSATIGQKQMPTKSQNVKKDINGNFSAPTIVNKSQMMNSGKIRDIYVSPFQTNVTVDDIVTHILTNTDIGDVRLFMVQKLIGQNESTKRKTYVSFKISTFNDDIYETILNKELWGPNQTARPFDSNFQERKLGQNISHPPVYNRFNNIRNDNQFKQHDNFQSSYNAQNSTQPRYNQNYQNYQPRYNQNYHQYNNQYRRMPYKNGSRLNFVPPPRFDKYRQNEYQSNSNLFPPRFNNNSTQHQQNQNSNNNYSGNYQRSQQDTSTYSHPQNNFGMGNFLDQNNQHWNVHQQYRPKSPMHQL